MISIKNQGFEQGKCLSEPRQLTHTDQSTLIMQGNTLTLHVLGALLDHLSKACIERIREADVSDDTALEEGEGTDALCAIDDLVGDDKVHWLNLLLERADGGKGDDTANADVPQGGDVCAVGDLVGGKLVMQAVTGEEGDVDAIVR
jgi:hypothetical protein